MTVNAVHPGLVRTDIPRNMSPGMRIANLLAAPLMMFLQKTPVQGAYCTLHVAVSPEWEGIGGKYIADCVAVDCSPAARNTDAAEEMWRVSESITGPASRPASVHSSQ